MRSFVVTAALSALTMVSAQSNFTIDPSEVTLTTRATWCQGQTATCNTLCDSDPNSNDCAPDTLAYDCTCSNGSAPGLQYYQQTMPTFICQQAFSDCNLANVGNAAGQKNCTDTIQNHCGTLNANDYTPAATASSSSAASSATATSSSTSSSASASATTTATSAAVQNIQHFGTAAVVVAMGLFAYML